MYYYYCSNKTPTSLRIANFSRLDIVLSRVGIRMMFETYFIRCEVFIKAAQARPVNDDVDSAGPARGDSNNSAVIRPEPVTNVKSIMILKCARALLLPSEFSRYVVHCNLITKSYTRFAHSFVSN